MPRNITPEERLAAAEEAEARLREMIAEARGLAGDIRRERDRAAQAIRDAHIAATEQLRADLADIRETYAGVLQEQYERMLADTAAAAQQAVDALASLAGCKDWPALVEVVSTRAERLCLTALANALGPAKHVGDDDVRLAARVMAAYPHHFTGSHVLGIEVPTKVLQETADARRAAATASARNPDWTKDSQP